MPAIERRPWWSAERLRRHQQTRLISLVSHAYQQVGFYRDLWDKAGIHPCDIRTLEDLSRLPVTSFRTFKAAQPEYLLARNIDARRCCSERTSGSNGQPLNMRYLHDERFVLVKAMAFRFHRSWGVRLRDRHAGFSYFAERCGAHSWYERFGLWRRLNLFAGADPQEWIGPLVRWQPDVLSASPMTLRLLVPLLREQGVRLRPRVVFCSGARLEPFDRLAFEEVLGARIADVYGCWEGGMLAWQCPVCPGYHINTDTAIVEVLKDGRPCLPGEPGEVVITNLYSHAMPIIRYSVGDVAELSPHTPSCGRNLPLLQHIWGRNNDVVRLPSGKVVGHYQITPRILSYEFVREWQIIQEKDASCELRIVPVGSPQQVPVAQVCREMGEVFQREVEVRVSVLDKIEREPLAKWKSIVSHFSAG